MKKGFAEVSTEGSAVHYRLAVALATVLSLASTGPATARLSDVSPAFHMKRIEAIHRPTGCVATLEFDGSTLIGAVIVDPLCLPAGVKARAIPAFLRDFHVPASKREIIRLR